MKCKNLILLRKRLTVYHSSFEFLPLIALWGNFPSSNIVFTFSSNETTTMIGATLESRDFFSPFFLACAEKMF